MRKTTITISFDEEKLTAMRLYMSQKDLKLEGGAGPRHGGALYHLRSGECPGIY